MVAHKTENRQRENLTNRMLQAIEHELQCYSVTKTLLLSAYFSNLSTRLAQTLLGNSPAKYC